MKRSISSKDISNFRRVSHMLPEISSNPVMASDELNIFNQMYFTNFHANKALMSYIKKTARTWSTS